MTAPFPASGTLLPSIRESSRSLREASQIQITPASIKRLLTSAAFTTSFKRVSASHGLALPLNFPSPLAELNLLSILSLLNFASGYRIPLHAETGRGAWDCIRAFAFSLYLTSSVGEGNLLSAKGMQTITNGKTAELLGVNVHVEKPHESIPGLTVGELGGPLYELVKLITRVLNETGEALENTGYPDLGTLVAESLKEGAKISASAGADAGLDVILEKLVRAIPAFRDMSVVNGQPIYCFKKALFLIHAISIRFGDISPSPFPVPSTAHLPVFTDNVLPSLLIHLGVIDISASPTLAPLFPDAGTPPKLTNLLGEAPSISPASKDENKVLPKEGPILTETQAYMLRAAAIDACELIIDEARNTGDADGGVMDWVRDIQLPELDMWIWAVAKDRRDYRELPRFSLRNTEFF